MSLDAPNRFSGLRQLVKHIVQVSFYFIRLNYRRDENIRYGFPLSIDQAKYFPGAAPERDMQIESTVKVETHCGILRQIKM
jgi:hypothetical protein